ncbi:MAG: hypothetical protein NTV04_03680, partial [Deltaproteobacteria bacterium]|nr:hypothetical protein [Deltaproteobacteria bacterium]
MSKNGMDRRAFMKSLRPIPFIDINASPYSSIFSVFLLCCGRVLYFSAKKEYNTNLFVSISNIIKETKMTSEMVRVVLTTP